MCIPVFLLLDFHFHIAKLCSEMSPLVGGISFEGHIHQMPP